MAKIKLIKAALFQRSLIFFVSLICLTALSNTSGALEDEKTTPDKSIFSSLVFDENRFGAEMKTGQLHAVYAPILNTKGETVLKKVFAPITLQKQQETTPSQTIKKSSPARASQKESPKTFPKKSENIFSQNSSPIPLSKWSSPSPSKNKASIFVIDEDSYLLNQISTVPNVNIYWIHPKSGLKSKTNHKGLAHSPYPKTQSIRFIAHKKGYLPALGYAVKGQSTMVMLYREKRLAPILTGLNVGIEKKKHVLLGKIIDKNYKPIKDVQVHISENDPAQVFYSIGEFGVFMRKAEKSGPKGDFLVNHLDSELQYLIPYLKKKKLPTALVDLKSLPAVLTITLRNTQHTQVETQVVDGFHYERPDTGIRVNVGGQKMPHVPDDIGNVQIEDLYQKEFIDLMEIEANGYQKTWISPINDKEHFPPYIAVFSKRQLSELLDSELSSTDLKKGIVVGHLNHKRFPTPVQVRVFHANGRENEKVRILYFDENNTISAEQDRTNSHFQNFAITNIGRGEYHLIIQDPETGHGLSSHVIRADNEAVTQVEL